MEISVRNHLKDENLETPEWLKVIRINRNAGDHMPIERNVKYVNHSKRKKTEPSEMTRIIIINQNA